jgi:hypothetical protein
MNADGYAKHSAAHRAVTFSGLDATWKTRSWNTSSNPSSTRRPIARRPSPFSRSIAPVAMP